MLTTLVYRFGAPGADTPPQRTMADSHQIKCHLSDAKLAEMEPVIEVGVAAE